MFPNLIEMASFWVTQFPTKCFLVALQKLRWWMLQQSKQHWQDSTSTPTTASRSLLPLSKEMETSVSLSLSSRTRTVSLFLYAAVLAIICRPLPYLLTFSVAHKSQVFFVALPVEMCLITKIFHLFLFYHPGPNSFLSASCSVTI